MPTKPKLPENWDPSALTDTVTFRDKTYTIRELSVLEFKKINDRAEITETIMIGGDEREIKRVDANIQSNLMVEACVFPQPAPPVGIRLFSGLWEKVRALNFGEEPDQTPKKRGKSDGDESGAAADEADSGN